MPDTTVSPEELEAFLRGIGLIPADYSGEVVVSAKTDDGSESVTIEV